MVEKNLTQQKNVAVLGAGIAGLGVARALALEGFSVTLIERRAVIASGTSDNSLRIIHGGFRYLQQAAIKRIIDSVRDQNFCLEKYPGIVRPLLSVMPLAKLGFKSRIPVFIAAKIYAVFLRFLGSPLKAPSIISNGQANEIFPWATGQFKSGALCWEDAQLLSHPMLVQKLCDELRAMHVQLEASTTVTALSQSGNSGKVEIQLDTGAVREFDFAVESFGHDANALGQKFNCDFAIACNLVFKKTFQIDHALGFSGEGGRLFFLVPRNGSDAQEIALGTEYLPFNGVVATTGLQQKQFLDAAKKALPSLPLQIEDLIRVECGVVPIEKNSNLKLKGRTEIKQSGAIFSLLPSKYTTFRSVGTRVASLLKRSIVS